MYITTECGKIDSQNFEAKIISKNTTITNNFLIDVLIAIRIIFGGKIGFYTRLTEEAREYVFQELQKNAKELGASHLVGVRYETNSIHPGTVEILVYGTALIPK